LRSRREWPRRRTPKSRVNLGDPGEIERAVAAFARAPNGGLVMTTGAAGGPSRAPYGNLIITLAARHRLPAVYPYRYYVAAGGLIS
jgi:putative ABC transport system substrate-binding protein